MARSTREDIDRFFDYGLHAPTRTIYIGSCSTLSDDQESATDYRMAEYAIKALHVLDLTNGAITIRMNNMGGDYCHGMAIYDAIKGCSNEITIIGTGYVMSMGLIILQAGDHRFLTENASVMWHPGESSFEGHTTNLQATAKEEARTLELCHRLAAQHVLAKNISMSQDDFNQMFKFDVFLSAQQAVDLGFADSILS